MNYEEIFDQLERGEIRSVIIQNDGSYAANTLVKEAILTAFRQGENVQLGSFVDKHNIPARQFQVSHGVRLVPGGSSVRRGSYIAPGVIVMPPSYINIGAYVDEGSMVDSHVLVGSCAQIGKNVHLSAGVQIGGVLEPIGQTPVVIEDGAFLGAGSVVVEGICVGKNAVIAPGVILSQAMHVYDVVHEKILKKGSKIPDGAVVVPGMRPFHDRYGWARAHDLGLQCPIIIKYRDDKTNASLSLEEALRK